jgi:hypothetical protein
MARLARDSGVLPFALNLQNIGVTLFTGPVPGVRDRKRRRLRDGVSAVMSVFSEAPGNKKGAYAEEHQYSGDKYDCDAEQMFGVFQQPSNPQFQAHL